MQQTKSAKPDNISFASLKRCISDCFRCSSCHNYRRLYQSWIVVIVGSIVYELCSYFVMRSISRFYDDIHDQDKKNFCRHLLYTAIIIFLSALSKTAVLLGKDSVAICCRVNMVDRMLSNFISYSRDLQNKTTQVDSPDQRITQDIIEFCTTLTDSITKILFVPIVTIYYSIWLSIHINIFVPVFCFLYFLIGYLFVSKFSSILSIIRYDVDKAEGTFRSYLFDILSNADSIACSRGIEAEHIHCEVKYEAVINLQRDSIRKKFPLQLSVSLFDYFGAIVSYLILGLVLLTSLSTFSSHKKIEYASIPQFCYACIYLISQFSSIIDLSIAYTLLVALGSRIDQLRQILCSNVKQDDQHLSHTLYREHDNETSRIDSSSCSSSASFSWRTIIDSCGTLLQIFPSSKLKKDSISDVEAVLLPSMSNPYESMDLEPLEILRKTSSMSNCPSDNNEIYHLLPSNNNDEGVSNGKIQYSLKLVDNGYPSMLIVKNVTVLSLRDHTSLISSISFTIRAFNDSLLVMGPSGCGKSTLLRILTNLPYCSFPSKDICDNSSVIQYSCSQQDIWTLPQLPYVFNGTLLENILYPYTSIDVENATANIDWKLLHLCAIKSGFAIVLYQLYHQRNEMNDRDHRFLDQDCMSLNRESHRLTQSMLQESLNYQENWNISLSLGQKQMLQFCRMMMKSPKLILIDEGTSALDEDTEDFIYGNLRHYWKYPFISCGHRSTLKQHHHQLIKVSPTGSYHHDVPQGG